MGVYLKLGLTLGWQDIKQAYRRSVVGPFWLTGGMAIQITTMAIVFGMIFKSDIQTYFPFVAASIIIWGFISATLIDGCQSFIAGEAIIKQISVPLYVHVVRSLWKNVLTFGHNLAILPIVFIVLGTPVNLNIFYGIPSVILVLINLTWASTLLGAISARFRDVPPIVNSLITVAFYVTPVMWYPNLIGNNELAHLLLGLNPIYHLLQILRLPVLGQIPTIENWLISLALALLGCTITYLVMLRFQKKIAYWV